jgi:hypothetical protein
VLANQQIILDHENCFGTKHLTGTTTKTASPPTILGTFGITISRNNWNIDWAVSDDQYFRRFIADLASVKGEKVKGENLTLSCTSNTAIKLLMSCITK